MSGHRGHLGSKPAREIFLTSSCLSFSSLSSSCASWDDATELNTKTPRASCEEHKGKHSDASSQGSETSGVTHVTMQPAPSPPSMLPPLQLMNKVSGTPYDPERIPESVFGKTVDLNWSALSSESLFSLRMSSCQAFSQSNLKPEEFSTSSECLAYSPYLLFNPEDAEEKRSQVKETKSEVSSVDTKSHGENSSSSPPPAVSWSTNSRLNQAPPRKIQSFSLPVGEENSKKRKKTRKSKKKKKKNMYCIWSWLFSGFPKCDCNLCCYKWTKCARGCCCRGPKAMVF